MSKFTLTTFFVALCSCASSTTTKGSFTLHITEIPEPETEVAEALETPPKTENPPSVKELPKLLILPMAGNVKEELLRTLDGIAATSALLEQYNAMGVPELDALMGLEITKDMAGCTDDVTCMAEIAGAVNAAYIVSGAVNEIGEELTISLSLINVRKAEVKKRTSVCIKKDEKLYRNAFIGAMEELFGTKAAEKAAEKSASSGNKKPPDTTKKDQVVGPNIEPGYRLFAVRRECNADIHFDAGNFLPEEAREISLQTFEAPRQNCLQHELVYIRLFTAQELGGAEGVKTKNINPNIIRHGCKPANWTSFTPLANQYIGLRRKYTLIGTGSPAQYILTIDDSPDFEKMSYLRADEGPPDVRTAHPNFLWSRPELRFAAECR